MSNVPLTFFVFILGLTLIYHNYIDHYEENKERCSEQEDLVDSVEYYNRYFLGVDYTPIMWDIVERFEYE